MRMRMRSSELSPFTYTVYRHCLAVTLIMSDLLDYQLNTKGNTTQNIAKCILLLPALSAPVTGDSAGKGTNFSLFLVIMRGKYFYVHLHNGISTMKNLPNGVPIY